MKYIRGQDGHVRSVSQLLPPGRVMVDGEYEWYLSVITACGQKYEYARYTTQEEVFKAWRFVLAFMATDCNLLLANKGGQMTTMTREGETFPMRNEEDEEPAT